MAEENSSNVQLADQEQTTPVLQTEPHTSSVSCDDVNNPTVNAIISSTIENDHTCAVDNRGIHLHLNDETSCAEQNINEYESFSSQNSENQMSNVAQHINIDQCDDEYDKNNANVSTEVEQDDNESFRVEDFFRQTISDNVFQTDASPIMFEDDDQDQHEIESELTTTHSNVLNPTQQSTASIIASLPEITVQRNGSISMIGEKVNNVMKHAHYGAEIKYVRRNISFNILLVGPARVGKSSLVNALTGNAQHVAKTSATLESCTQVLDRYEVHYEALDDVPEDQKCKVFIWDTKGVEDWGQKSGVNSMFQFIERTKPICVIFCAAPGALAKLDQVRFILDYCHWRQILCVTVLTNMWSGSTEARDTVMGELLQLVSKYGTQEDWTFSNDNPTRHLSKHTVYVFGNQAICTMVNSQPFVHPLMPDRPMPVQGIDELTHCIMQLLTPEQLQAWCQVVLGNRSFFEKLHHQADGFVSDRYEFLRGLAATVVNDMDRKVKTFGAHFVSFFENLIK